jgi:hypothetical protein
MREVTIRRASAAAPVISNACFAATREHHRRSPEPPTHLPRQRVDVRICVRRSPSPASWTALGLHDPERDQVTYALGHVTLPLVFDLYRVLAQNPVTGGDP